MKTFRIVVGVLAIIPLGLLIYHLFFESLTYEPNSIIEYVYLVLGIPILIINYWAWLEPEIIEKSIFGKKKEE